MSDEILAEIARIANGRDDFLRVINTTAAVDNFSSCDISWGVVVILVLAILAAAAQAFFVFRETSDVKRRAVACAPLSLIIIALAFFLWRYT